MTTIKISELPPITGADAATTDVLPIVDVSVTTTKKITREEFFKNVSAIEVTGDVTIADKIVHASDTNTSIRFPAADTVTVETAGTERMRITSAGNVGIGTSSPAARLDVFSSSATEPAVRITQTGAGDALVVEDSTSPDATPFVVGADGTVRVQHNAAWSGITAPAVAIDANQSAAFAQTMYGYNAANPILSFVTGGGTTFGANTAVAASRQLGVMRFYGTDGTAPILAAQIAAFVDGTPGTNDMPGRLVFSTTADGASSTTERMRIDSSGNVGVGTTSPADLLHVSKNGDSIARVTSADGLGDAAVRFYSGATYKGQVGWDQSSDVLALYAPGNATTPALSVGTGGIVYRSFPAQTVKSAAATLTIAELLTGIIQYTGALATLTLPTGTDIEGGLPATPAVNLSFDFSVINTGSGVVTLGTATGLTLVGGMTVAVGASGLFRVRKTATNTYTVYRIS